MATVADLGSEIAELAARLDAATHRLLGCLREFDQSDEWAAQGAVSCAHWLCWRIGLDPGTAREKVRVARALGQLPKLDEGLRLGRSNFQSFVGKREVKDRADADLTQEPETLKAFRDTWELGIHSYLTYLRDRLLLAKDLLSSTGSVFVQISDENPHHVRELMDEVRSARTTSSP